MARLVAHSAIVTGDLRDLSALSTVIMDSASFAVHGAIIARSRQEAQEHGQVRRDCCIGEKELILDEIHCNAHASRSFSSRVVHNLFFSFLSPLEKGDAPLVDAPSRLHAVVACLHLFCHTLGGGCSDVGALSHAVVGLLREGRRHRGVFSGSHGRHHSTRSRGRSSRENRKPDTTHPTVLVESFLPVTSIVFAVHFCRDQLRCLQLTGLVS